MLITPEYLDQQRKMHERKVYGDSGKKWAKLVGFRAKQYDCQTILDYGCGVGAMAARLRADFDIREYDPAIPEKSGAPNPAHMVVCVDTLEHVEPDCLIDVIAHLRALTVKVLFVVVATRLAGKTLPDGRNAHLIVEDWSWWSQHFNRFKVLDRTEVIDEEWRAVMTLKETMTTSRGAARLKGSLVQDRYDEISRSMYHHRYD